jgi:8-oxo-dGTP pyrophosphatase MutT (NUDIX family)
MTAHGFAEITEHLMPVPDFVRELRKHVGHDLLLLPGVSGMVINDAGEVLLQRRSDTGRWALIGGILEPGEDPADAVVREVFEETGLRVEPIRAIGIYTTPIITYPNQDRAMYVITAFRCRVISGEPGVNDEESLEVRYFAPDALPDDLRDDFRERIEHALRDELGAVFRYQGRWRFDG